MKLRTSWLAIIVLAVSLVAQAAPVNRFILRASSTSSAQSIAKQHKLTYVGPLDNQNRGLYVVTAPTTLTIQQVLDDVRSDSNALGFEADLYLGVSELPASLSQSTAAILDKFPAPTAASYYGSPVLGAYLSQPAVTLINLRDVQTTFGLTGAGTVAIIDTGVDPNHPVLKNSLVNGYDFVRNQSGIPNEMADLSQSTAAILDGSSQNILDKSAVAIVNQSTAAILDQNTANLLASATVPPAFGHGTMVAGVVHLTAPTAKIMPLKAFRGDGTANLSDILRAIYFATDNGAKVINMSFSLLTYSAELDNAIRYAEHAGVTCVASNGNLGAALVTQPAALNRVIAVASTSNTDQKSFFTSYGPPTWITAPGEGVITTYPGSNYAAAWGTSFSTPFVSGAASLMVQVDSKANYSETSNWLTRAKQLTPDLGHGRLDLYQALANTSNATSTTSGSSGSSGSGSGN